MAAARAGAGAGAGRPPGEIAAVAAGCGGAVAVVAAVAAAVAAVRWLVAESCCSCLRSGLAVLVAAGLARGPRGRRNWPTFSPGKRVGIAGLL